MEWRARFLAKASTPCSVHPCRGLPPAHQLQKRLVPSTSSLFTAGLVEDLEALLPMKNRTLTYSYLLLSREIQDQTWRGAARVIGDTLEENGKTRQLICRGAKREFLSWLHRHGPAPRIPHGALIRGSRSVRSRVRNCA